jgi:hypothetical protein
MTHALKTWSVYFEQSFLGNKNFEIRKNDRNFQVGDFLILHEWNKLSSSYTGRQLIKKISYIYKGGSFGLEKDYVILSL